jgi:hypothetical protein
MLLRNFQNPPTTLPHSTAENFPTGSLYTYAFFYVQKLAYCNSFSKISMSRLGHSDEKTQAVGLPPHILNVDRWWSASCSSSFIPEAKKPSLFDRSTTGMLYWTTYRLQATHSIKLGLTKNKNIAHSSLLWYPDLRCLLVIHPTSAISLCISVGGHKTVQASASTPKLN